MYAGGAVVRGCSLTTPKLQAIQTACLGWSTSGWMHVSKFLQRTCAYPKADTDTVGSGLMMNIDLAAHTASASPALPR
jgi:hypothetical protein